MEGREREREHAVGGQDSPWGVFWPVVLDNEQVHSLMLITFYLCIYGRKFQTWLGLCCHINYRSFKGGKKNPKGNKDFSEKHSCLKEAACKMENLDI